MKKFSVLFFLFVLAGSLSAQTIFYVKKSGDNAWEGRSNVYTDNIQSAIDAAAAQAGEQNAQVWIAKGEYTLTTTLTPQSGVDVIGGFVGTETDLSKRSFVGKGANQTILVGGNNIRPITQTADLAEPCFWTNLVITKGSILESDGEGGGALLNSGMTLKGCIIRDNEAAIGGGVCLKGNAQLINCLVENNPYNDAGKGRGIFCENDTKVINCTVIDNSPPHICYGCDPSTGDGIYAKDNAFIANTISYGNKPRMQGAPSNQQIYVVSGSNVTITYCAISEGDGSLEKIATHSVVLAKNPTNYNSESRKGNFELYINNKEGVSSCIDAGSNDFVTEELDLNGYNRIILGGFDALVPIVDIGAFEFDPDYYVGIEKNVADAVVLYPNPASDNIVLEGIDEGAYTIANAVGVTISGGLYQGDAIDISTLQQGFYFISIDNRTIPFVKK